MSELTRRIVKTSRGRLEMTQAELGTMLDLSTVAVGQMETDPEKPSHREPSGDVLARIVVAAWPGLMT